MNSILGKWIKKRNKSDFVVLILLGGDGVARFAMATGKTKPERNTERWWLWRRNMKGVTQVALYTKGTKYALDDERE